MTGVGETLACMSTTERLARRTLALLAGSVVSSPRDTTDLGVWLAANVDRLPSLSSGEKTLMLLALAVWCGDSEVSVAELGRLDADNRQAVAAILGEWLGA